MPLGPGKYGAQAEAFLRKHGGTMCVIIQNGQKGWGFDVATADPALLRELPGILRETADKLDQDLWAGGKRHFQ